MKKNMIIAAAVFTIILVILILLAMQNKGVPSSRQENGQVKPAKVTTGISSRNTIGKNVSQKPSNPADFKSIPPEQLDEPKTGAGEVSLDQDDKPIVDSKGNPVLK